MALSEIYNEDCMIGMSRYPDKFFDLAIVDPEYGLGVSKRKYLGGDKNGTSYALQKNGKRLLVKNKSYVPKSWDEERANASYFAELERVSRNQIIWGGNYFADLLKPSAGWIVWDKEQSGNYADCELAWTSFNRAVRMVTVRWNGMIQYDMGNKEERIHPTQKPLPLYKWTLQNYATIGDKILDTHLGSGSSRIAAYDMGFDFYGWEIDKDYFEASCKRFDDFKKQGNLFRA